MKSRLLLRVDVRCSDLPGLRFVDPMDALIARKEPVYLGIQRGREVIDQVPANRRSARFTAEFVVTEQADGSPNFLGPFAQGTPADRFFYLSWGVKKRGGPFEMFRRLKVRLGHLKWRAIRTSASSGKPIIVELRLTDAKDAPLCATPPKSHVRWRAS